MHLFRTTAIYVKYKLICREIKLRGVFEDHVWAEISLKSKDTLLCGCTYRNPTVDKLSTMESTSTVCELIKGAGPLHFHEKCKILIFHFLCLSDTTFIVDSEFPH